MEQIKIIILLQIGIIIIYKIDWYKKFPKVEFDL